MRSDLLAIAVLLQCAPVHSLKELCDDFKAVHDFPLTTITKDCTDTEGNYAFEFGLEIGFDFGIVSYALPKIGF